MPVDIPIPNKTKKETTEVVKEEKKEEKITETREKPIDVLMGEFQKYTKTQRQVAFLEILSAQPPKSWVKNTDEKKPDNKYMKDAKGRLVPYIDISRMWWIMDTLLMNPRLEILSMKTERVVLEESVFTDQNGVQHKQYTSKDFSVCTVRLHYYHHGIELETYVDGIAAGEISGNQKVELVYPKVRAEAAKNAMKNIGNILGRSLDRDDLVITQDSVPWTRKSAKEKLIGGGTGGENGSGV